jgi:hypothetical protein
MNEANETTEEQMQRSIKRRRRAPSCQILLLLLGVSTTTVLLLPVVDAFTVSQAPPRHYVAPLFAESSMGRTWQQRSPERDYPDQQGGANNNRNIVPQEQEQQQPLPVKGYDASAILNYYDKHPLDVGWRLNSLGLPLLGWYIGLLGDKFIFRNQDQEHIQRQRGAELRQHLVRSKSVALIKV